MGMAAQLPSRHCDTDTVCVWPSSKASAVPGASRINVMLLFWTTICAPYKVWQIVSTSLAENWQACHTVTTLRAVIDTRTRPATLAFGTQQ